MSDKKGVVRICLSVERPTMDSRRRRKASEPAITAGFPIHGCGLKASPTQPTGESPSIDCCQSMTTEQSIEKGDDHRRDLLMRALSAIG